ncbi:MAG: hypothetical protein A3G59_03730 [Candidatus Taylorbacteria bacterium RIFCSPLOWO2_12_FULL_47_20]|uniref:RecF/RecN/SMC N-terminal domain-containing protein n=2 Tax=Candidatus Tayloriibacteriota TaxID=1817919 RepID=A0A1G2P8B6_9BACT|nr:MAG: hypothetical protein A3H68_02790 [Candidatus Taylorbacteria bacterium RIFCSPLOWO2_02_FULL_46_40]OHA44577.1 MAG: hypothetical protein A3G59_03730 [Candidatus Taylorbacteria bacterium RIFCSPLOWO2_12_FULL_47_20]
MYLKKLEVTGFKSFGRKSLMVFDAPVTAIVGPNGSGKSNISEAFRFVLGEQSMKSMRGRKGEDMIWNGSPSLSRLNRAGVKLTFDNSRKFLNSDFDEVVVERVVHRDGLNEYLLNGTFVRLRDILELLASAHVGPSGHHIISQGEADRALNANPRERRVIIEDALGLKIYQLKKQESRRKLDRTAENLERAESLRREIAPHIKFLSKQVEKIEKSRSVRQELVGLYREYFTAENIRIKYAERDISARGDRLRQKAELMDSHLADAKKDISAGESVSQSSQKIRDAESQFKSLRDRKEKETLELGRVLGELSFEVRKEEQENRQKTRDESVRVEIVELRKLGGNADSLERDAASAEPQALTKMLEAAIGAIRMFVAKYTERIKAAAQDGVLSPRQNVKERLEQKKREVEERLSRIRAEEEAVSGLLDKLKDDMEKEKDKYRDAEKEMIRIMSERKEIAVELDFLHSEERECHVQKEDYERELREAAALAGDAALDFSRKTPVSPADFGAAGESQNDRESMRNLQHERRRRLEKLKVKLEELGGGSGAEIIKEFQEAKERDAFLAVEIDDLVKTSESLDKLISDLELRLDVEFREGLKKINTEFNNFFTLMFGGGSAEICLVKEKEPESVYDLEIEGFSGVSASINVENKEEKEVLPGLEIKVNLPRKKIKSLEMLSGGERALTSIALIFAVSQVNPPPFIILDETDAALDESNSKKYGNMIENLAKYSQLIVITHNRETMSRAGMLYGVTMGADGVSKLLSVKFGEAVTASA